MTESPNTAQDEELQICSTDGLQRTCKKHPKLLLISTNTDRRNFIQKFVDVAVPKDLTVASVDVGGSCETLVKLGLNDACRAVLIEKGKVKREIVLQDDDVKDAVGLMKLLSEDKKSRLRKNQ